MEVRLSSGKRHRQTRRSCRDSAGRNAAHRSWSAYVSWIWSSSDPCWHPRSRATNSAPRWPFSGAWRTRSPCLPGERGPATEGRRTWMKWFRARSRKACTSAGQKQPPGYKAQIWAPVGLSLRYHPQNQPFCWKTQRGLQAQRLCVGRVHRVAVGGGSQNMETAREKHVMD